MGCSSSKAAEPEAPQAGTQSDKDKDDSPGFFDSIKEAVGDAVDAVQDAVEDAVDAVQDMADPFDKFEKKMKQSVSRTLKWISPKASDKVKTTMKEQMPVLQSLDLDEPASTAVTESIMNLKQPLFDFCEDLLEDIQDGLNPFKALFKTFKTVGVMLLRCVRDAVGSAVRALFNLAGSCFSMCAAQIDMSGIITTIYNKCSKMVKRHLKKLMNKKAPAMLVKRLPWNWSADDDIGDAQPKCEAKKAAGTKTAKQEQRAKAGKPEDEDSDDEDDEDSDDEEEDDDAYEDFDAETGEDDDGPEEKGDQKAPEEQAPAADAPKEA